MGFGDTTHSGCDTRIRQLTDQRQDLYDALKVLIESPELRATTSAAQVRAQELVAKLGPYVNASRRLY